MFHANPYIFLPRAFAQVTLVVMILAKNLAAFRAMVHATIATYGFSARGAMRETVLAREMMIGTNVGLIYFHPARTLGRDDRVVEKVII